MANPRECRIVPVVLLILLWSQSARSYSPPANPWSSTTTRSRTATTTTKVVAATGTNLALLSAHKNGNSDWTVESSSSVPALTRRTMVSLLWSAMGATTTTVVAPQLVHASLLDDYGSNPSKIEPAPVVVASAATTTTTPSSSTSRVEIDPSLRASYYYPTAKKRYLPRIQKVTAEISACSNALAVQDWETAESFGKTAENAILPLQLYVSSLDGQGLSMSTGFAKQMRQDALDYQAAYKVFDQAVQQRDSATALMAVSQMGVAVADYRQTGRLKDDDGNIPSIDEMKRMAMRRPTVAVAAK